MNLPSFDPTILTVDDEVRLLGGRCTRCETVHLPARTACPSCGAPVTAVQLPSTGVVHAATAWLFDLAGLPGPVTVVLVDLPVGIRVQGAATGPVGIGSTVRIIATSMGDVAAFVFEAVDG